MYRRPILCTLYGAVDAQAGGQALQGLGLHRLRAVERALRVERRDVGVTATITRIITEVIDVVDVIGAVVVGFVVVTSQVLST